MRFAGVLTFMLALAIGLAASPAAGASTSPLRVPDSAAPTFSVFTSRDGLNEEIWSTVGVGPDGFVWAGSASALARFDGYRWSALPVPPGRSLVRDMATDVDGTLWAIFEREGLARYDGKHWQLVGPTRFHHRFSTTGRGAQRQLWAAHNDGLARLDDGRWIDHPAYRTQGLGRPIAIARTESLLGGPREWLGTADAGLWYRDIQPEPGPWQRVADPHLRQMSVTDLMRSGDESQEELWVVSYGGGIARLRNDGTRIWRSSSGELPSEANYSAVETGSGYERTVWIASRAGLLRFRGEQLAVFDRRHGLPADAVRGVKVQRRDDGTDALWVATESGLARAVLADSPWLTVSLLGATENGVFGVLIEPDGRGGERLWLGSAKEGLAMLQDGEWRRFPPGDDGMPEGSVRGIWRLPDDDGGHRRMLGAAGAPLIEITDDLQFRPFPTPWLVQPDAVATHLMAREADDAIEWWVGTSTAGIFRYRSGEWQAFPTLGDVPPAPVNWIVEQRDQHGRSWLWAADTRGLARFDGQRWERLPAALGVPSDGLRSLSVITDEDGQTLWGSSTHQGLFRLDISDPLLPQRLDDTGLPPPPDPTIYSVLPDGRGRLYVCTNNGVQQLTRQPDGSYTDRVFRRRDGLVHDECNTNGQLVDGHGRFWVGTLGGLSMFDPDAQPARQASTPRPLRFTELRLDGQLLPAPEGLKISVPASVQELRLEYALLTGLRESESRYRTQLIGFDAAAAPWSSERSRSFSTLPPGEYRFRVEASDFAGTLAEPRELLIVVTPLWWQQVWLQVLVAIALGLLAGAIVLGYNRRLHRRQKLLRHQVAERTRDLHDANLRLTELSYLDPLTGLANRRRLTEAMRSAIERAAQQGKPIGLIVADVDRFKQYNDRHGHLAGDAALRAIATALDSAMREQDLVARFGGEEFACLMEDADLQTVSRVAERMRALVEALPPRSLGNDRDTVTLSAGVLSVVPEASQQPEELLHAADQALYAAKATGRNRVCAAGTRVG